MKMNGSDRSLEVIGFIFVMAMLTIFIINLATGLGMATLQLLEYLSVSIAQIF